jgi:AcrR family transcriptional regulator
LADHRAGGARRGEPPPDRPGDRPHHGVVTHYFRDKRELMAFAFGLVVDRSTSRMARGGRGSGYNGGVGPALPLDAERRRETTVWLALMSASLTDPDLAVELRQRYRRAREAILPMFRTALERRTEKTPMTLRTSSWRWWTESPSMRLPIPERYPPGRQLALLRRALVRLGLSVESPATGAS